MGYTIDKDHGMRFFRNFKPIIAYFYWAVYRRYGQVRRGHMTFDNLKTNYSIFDWAICRRYGLSKARFLVGVSHLLIRRKMLLRVIYHGASNSIWFYLRSLLIRIMSNKEI
jgi:hypothetical protein